MVEGAGEVKRESRQGNSSPRGARRALHASASSRKRHSADVGPEAECRLTPMSRPLRSSPLALLSPSLMSAAGLSLFSRLSLLSTRRQPPLIFLSSEYERNIKRGRLGGGLFARRVIGSLRARLDRRTHELLTFCGVSGSRQNGSPQLPPC